MRVLFLDVDGVLNSSRTVLTSGDFPHPHNYERRREMFDWTAIKMLQGLCRSGDLKVVLSSSWRLGADAEWLTKFGEFLGLPIIDKTPTDWRPHQTRGHEIKAWLDNHAECTHYAIVDDDSDMLPEQKSQYVQTWHEDGLTWGPFAKLCDIFGINPWDCSVRRVQTGRAALDAGNTGTDGGEALDPKPALHACASIENYLRDRENHPFPSGALSVLRGFIKDAAGMPVRDGGRQG